MSLGKKVTLNSGHQIPCVYSAENIERRHHWSHIQPVGLWYLAVCPWPGQRGCLWGPQGWLPPPGMYMYIDHFFKLFANPPPPLRIWQLCMLHRFLNRKKPHLTIAIYLPPVHSYQNQREVAEGIKRAYKDVPGLKREDLFIVSLIHM